MRYKGWITTLFSLVFIAGIALIGYAFLLPDWTKKQAVSYGFLWLIGFGYLLYAILISYFFIFLKILNYQSLVFTIPLAFVFFIIFVTSPLPLWARALLVFAGIMITVPVNIFVENFHKKKL